MKNYLLDTNSIIYALNSNFIFPKNSYFVSVITEIELFSYHKLTTDEEEVLRQALSNFTNIYLTEDIKNTTIKIRKNFNLKLPDSLIVATALVQNATLVTSDKKLLKLDILKVIELKDLSF